ncbi:cytoplasmic protein [Brucella sp. NF 2653]|uniref:hypothetical protein n=1 Tax=unclassified Brucella TaxID=2632610 RepID=UPI0001BD7F08|nr:MULTISPECIES: hypothetical protein [unclassified Brucella]EEZ32644.1 conserved hypothetical protein [Brucella sp. 83/13]EFM63625.1 cytoplasmic protein [Brucella sp. NF 2653]
MALPLFSAKMLLPVGNPPSLKTLATGLILACGIALPASAKDTLQVALADRSEFLPLSRSSIEANRGNMPALVPLPDALPRAIPKSASDGAPAPLHISKAIPEIHRDFDKLPEPVRAMRERMLEAARSGDIERLRPLLGIEDKATQLALEDNEEDVIDFLKSLSGDEDGREVLAIITDLLDTGYVHLNVGQQNEVYVWPYFYAMPLDKLTPPQIVELFQIVTAGDFEDMKKAGGYIFYSIGIGPDGSWRFFTAGQ